MKNRYILKTFAFCQIIFASLTPLISHARNNINNEAVLHFHSESDLVNHAIKNIKKEVKKRSGYPYSISSVYKMTDDNTPISVSTKIYYADYHKTPASIHTDFNVQSNSTIKRVVEVVYKPNKKEQVALVDWDPKKQNRRLRSKKIKISNKI